MLFTNRCLIHKPSPVNTPPPEIWTDPGPIADSPFYSFSRFYRWLWQKCGLPYLPTTQDWIDQWIVYLNEQEEREAAYQMWLDQQAEWQLIQQQYQERGRDLSEYLIPHALHNMGLSHRRLVQERKEDRPYERIDYLVIPEWHYDDYAYYFWVATWPPFFPYGLTIDKFFPNQEDNPIAMTLTSALGANSLIEYNPPSHERAGLWIIVEHKSGRGQIPTEVSYQAMMKIFPQAQPLAWPLGYGRNKTVYMGDIGEIYNLGIVGSVGGGKSNEINTILTSLVSRNSPADLRLFLVDMKRVELSFYRDIPHLGGDVSFIRKVNFDYESQTEKVSKNLRTITPEYEVKSGYKKFDPLGQKIITRPQDIVPLLDYILAEIERRTQLLERAEIKKIATWNNRHPHEKMSYWLLVIDELGDIMLRSEYKKKVEERLVRIFQLGRALGIHCIVATQTPKSSIITGLITNNITNWIVFRCSTGVSSGLVLDGRYDAARLPAVKGRCIFREGGQMIEMQTPYISDSAIKSAVDAAKKGDVMNVMDARLTVEADKIFRYALTETDGYCAKNQLFRAFRKNVSLHDMENILIQYEVKGTPPALEPEIEIDDVVYYLAPSPGGRNPRRLILSEQFVNEFDKWSDILATRGSLLTKNGGEPGGAISKPDEVTEDLEPIFA